ncbi:hypothetical protein E2C01_094198 [Portunus trituberculatus]|uniref:Uncharacterized protein n=1 Tax=Portunus trituberculatus TaxID=210409 RepID=A0A5B7JW95_PORTR|nr:hypothetical protein [Portunus trituberculatus]
MRRHNETDGDGGTKPHNTPDKTKPCTVHRGTDSTPCFLLCRTNVSRENCARDHTACCEECRGKGRTVCNGGRFFKGSKRSSGTIRSYEKTSCPMWLALDWYGGRKVSTDKLRLTEMTSYLGSVRTRSVGTGCLSFLLLL